MLTPAERAVLVVYCTDHPVAGCPQCPETVTFDRIGADLLAGRRDFCPKCRADLTDALRKHLKECTWIRVQTREMRERAQATQQQATMAQESQRLRNTADVLAHEAEAVAEKSRNPLAKDRPSV
jgi:hypothetical protein